MDIVAREAYKEPISSLLVKDINGAKARIRIPGNRELEIKGGHYVALGTCIFHCGARGGTAGFYGNCGSRSRDRENPFLHFSGPVSSDDGGPPGAPDLRRQRKRALNQHQGAKERLAR
jgi:hypothetical protein